MVGADNKTRTAADVDLQGVDGIDGLSKMAGHQVANAGRGAQVRKPPSKRAGSLRAEHPRCRGLVLAQIAQRFGREGEFQQVVVMIRVRR